MFILWKYVDFGACKFEHFPRWMWIFFPRVSLGWENMCALLCYYIIVLIFFSFSPLLNWGNFFEVSVAFASRLSPRLKLAKVSILKKVYDSLRITGTCFWTHHYKATACLDYAITYFVILISIWCEIYSESSKKKNR